MEPIEVQRFDAARRPHDAVVRLSDPTSRVRFAILCWYARASVGSEGRPQIERRDLADEIGAMRFGSADMSGDHVLESLSRLRALTEDVSPDDMTALDFARRVSLPVPEPRWRKFGDELWWDEFRRTQTVSASVALLAAHALELRLKPFEFDATENYPTLTLDEWRARHRLGDVLLRTATTASGRASDAQRMLARLAPFLIDEIDSFVRRSPRWVTACHFLDRALRAPYRHVGRPHPEVARVSAEFVTERSSGGFALLDRIRMRPPRATAALRLARRVGREVAVYHVRRNVARLFLDATSDTSLPVRARRFALWIAAENAIALPEAADTHAEVADLVAEACADPELADVGIALRSFEGGYTSWVAGEQSDFFEVEHGDDNQFVWPCTTAVHELLTDYVLPDQHDGGLFASPWDRPPRQAVSAARRMLLELLLHPGLVRVKAASDTLAAGGPAVASAVSRTISLMLEDARASQLPDHVVEIAINTISHVRGDDSPLRVLTRYVEDPGRSADCRAAAAAALGDVLYRMRRGDPTKSRKGEAAAVAVLGRCLRSDEVAIANAAIFAFRGLEIDAEAATLADLWRHHPCSLTRDLARWCLEEAPSAVVGLGGV